MAINNKSHCLEARVAPAESPAKPPGGSVTALEVNPQTGGSIPLLKKRKMSECSVTLHRSHAASFVFAFT